MDFFFVFGFAVDFDLSVAVFGLDLGFALGFVFLGSSVSGFGSLLKASTNLISVSSERNFCMSMAMPRLAIWMPST